MDYFKTYYEQLDIPTLYIRADHDYGAFYGASERLYVYRKRL